MTTATTDAKPITGLNTIITGLRLKFTDTEYARLESIAAKLTADERRVLDDVLDLAYHAGEVDGRQSIIDAALRV